MARYEYKAFDADRREHEGVIDAASIDDVVEKLEELNLVPISVDELSFDGSRIGEGFWGKLTREMHRLNTHVPYREVVFYTRQLATMLEGGVPLVRGLEQLAKSQKPVFKKIILQVAGDISYGHTYSEAISRHAGAFPPMYVSIIHSGEISGALDKVMNDLATYMENIEALKSKVKVAMRYPMFISAFITLLVIGILWKLVPQFASIYAGFGAQLPPATLLLVSLSDFVRNNIFLLFLMIAAAAVGFKFGLLNPAFRFQYDRFILKFPVFGAIVTKNILALYCRTMALLMNSGTPILFATEISAAILNNKIYAQALEKVHSSLRQGNMLSKALEDTKLFPVLVTQLVATGEESGKVDTLLLKASEFYEREIRNIVDSLAAIIEPFLIIILGGVVGAILIALYMPIFMIGKLLK